jgi:arylsulfatase A-like enzyme
MDRRKFLLTPLVIARAAAGPPNLVVITASGWRGQATPWDGDADLIAPNLERFGKQSVVFSRTYCACPDLGVTGRGELARTAMRTSRFPHASKLDDETFLHGKKIDSIAARKAFLETPFALEIELPFGSMGGLRNPANMHLRGNVPSNEEKDARKALALFYPLCRSADSIFGEILAALDDLKLAEDTVVAFTSDCGQQLGSHGLDGSGVAFEESVRIPLAIRYPRVLKPAARDLANQVDIMPTLFTLCGLEMPDGVQGQNLFGKTLPEVAYSEGKLGEADEWRMMVRGYDKLIATPKGEITHLFNLADDPFELTNLAHDPAQKLKLASLRAQLQAQMKKLSDGMDPSGLRRR